MKPAPIYHTLLMATCVCAGVLIGHWITAGFDAGVITRQREAIEQLTTAANDSAKTIKENKTTIEQLGTDLQEIRASIGAGLTIEL